MNFHLKELWIKLIFNCQDQLETQGTNLKVLVAIKSNSDKNFLIIRTSY